MKPTLLVHLALTKAAADADTINEWKEDNGNQTAINDAIRAARDGTPTATAPAGDMDTANEWFEDNANQKAINDAIREQRTPTKPLGGKPLATIQPSGKPLNVGVQSALGFLGGLGQGVNNMAAGFGKTVVQPMGAAPRIFGASGK